MATKDIGTTIRPASTALLTIDSEDRFANWVEKRRDMSNPKAPNYSPYNFSLIKNAVLVNGYMTRLAVSEVVFPWTYPNINNQTSIIGYFGDNGVLNTSGVIALPPGFYTPSELATIFQTSLQTVFATLGAGTMTCSYGVGGLPRFVVSFTAPPTFNFSFTPLVYGQAYTVGVNNYIWNYPSNTKQLFDVMGFTNDNLVPASFQIGQATFAQAVRYIDIISPQLTANQGLPDATSQSISDSALCRLYITANGELPTGTYNVQDPLFAPVGTQPFTIYRQFTVPKQIQWNAFMPIQGRIQFQVLDDNGIVLPTISTNPTAVYGQADFIAYSDWSMSLLLSEN